MEQYRVVELIPDAPELPITMCLYHSSVDLCHNNAVAAGAVSLVAPRISEWQPNEKYCIFQDINGYVWMIITIVS